jgi:hypothetical protein
MNPTMNENSASAMTRRGLLGALAAAGSALAVISFRGLFPQIAPEEGRRAIVSFHMDQLYLDWSGTAVPYLPPLGARSAHVAAHLTEETFRRHCIYL